MNNLQQELGPNVISVLKRINFHPLLIIKKFDKDRIYLLKGLLEESEVFLKLVDRENKSIIENLKREQFLTNLLNDFNSKSEKKINFVKYLKSGQIDNYFWIIREFKPGETLSDTEESASLKNYDSVKIKFLNQKNILDKVRDDVLLLRQVKYEKNSYVSRYREKSSDYDIDKIENYLKIDLSRVLLFSEKNQKNYWNEKKIVINFGDLSPSNIIVSGEDVILLDFELFSPENWMVDIAYLWLFLWRYPDWQKRVIELFVEDEEKEVDFVISVQRILLFLYWLPGNFLKEQKDYNQDDIIEYNKKHKWTKYLANSFDFNKLTK